MFANGDEFFFVGMPTSVAAIEGKNFTMDCQVSSRDQVQFFWHFNGKLFGNSTRRYQNNSQLIFESIYRERDEGIYQCVALNQSSGYSVASSNIQLAVFWIGPEASVKLIRPASGASLKNGDSLSLQCLVAGTTTEITWYRNNRQVKKKFLSLK